MDDTAIAISDGDDDADRDDADRDDAGDDDVGDGGYDNAASCRDRSSYSEMRARSNGSCSAFLALPNTRAT